ncbi:MAG: sigma-70 family RNA polymerase sigma factor [Nonomuraea sp.]|nr:sigma-70 family RNA polymerase sigma factor [Nonomuraea sp.]
MPVASVRVCLTERSSTTSWRQGPTGCCGRRPGEELWEAVGRLPAKQRAVIVLRFYEDLPVQEVARILGCHDGTATITRTRRRCRSRSRSPAGRSTWPGSATAPSGSRSRRGATAAGSASRRSARAPWQGGCGSPTASATATR